MVCVAPTHGGWYRAQIVSVDKDTDSSEVKFLDYGGFLSVDNSSLRQIRGDFLLLPFQAVECVLANVIPAGQLRKLDSEKDLYSASTTITLMTQILKLDNWTLLIPSKFVFETLKYVKFYW